MSFIVLQANLVVLQSSFRNTWYFDVCIILVSVSIIYYFIQKRIKESASEQKVLREKIRNATKDLQEEIKRAEDSEKAKEQFLANMSHEIRTPMNAIVQATRLLLEKDPKEEQRKYFHIIKQSSDNLLVIINDILDLSKIEAGRINFESIDFDLQETVAAAYNIVKINADEKKLALNYSFAEDVPLTVTGDPYRLTQIIINLAGNAIKFTEKGFVTIQVTCLEVKEQMAMIKFEIADSGIGIAADKLDYIFNMFTQESSSTTRKFGGTGLGLAISKRLVELQGGTIHVESELSKGSVFSIIIPYKVRDKTQITVKNTSTDNTVKPILSDLKILLAEDNEFNQMVAVDTLESSIKNATIDVAKNGREAVEMILKNGYDVVLMDVQMPEMDGHEATRIIRSSADEKINSVPIIAMTASVIKAEVDKCFESGMNEFVGKP
ncbi:MAG: response regulator, partial [Chitinophagales bacterium]|nr:response regulator [Chitinophagales bacterium]